MAHQIFFWNTCIFRASIYSSGDNKDAVFDIILIIKNWFIRQFLKFFAVSLFSTSKCYNFALLIL